ncbi:MAG TPA: hypothetical protein VLV83_19310 [Acidobacteriota bacterium]|nr:hypothetical protein [Acidobacteriota bacterium]
MTQVTSPAILKRQIEQTPDYNLQKLARAILAQAFSDALSPSKRNRDEVRADALEWFFATDDCAGSFDWICAILGLDPGPMRTWLQKRNALERDRRLARKIRSSLCRGAG